MNALIVSSSEGIAISLVRYLSLKNVKVHVINIWHSSKASRFSRFCNSYTSHSISEPFQETQSLIDHINQYCERKKIDLILPAGLLGTFVLSKIRNKLVCPIIYPTPTPEQINNLHNKWWFYQFLVEHQIPTPKTVLIEKVEQLHSLQIDFPVIVKPLSLGNGAGIQKIESFEGIERYVLDSQQSNQLPFLIQEYIPGIDVIFGILAKDGELVAWTLHERTNDFLKFFPNEVLLDIGRKIIAASNFNGAANFDVRFDTETGRVAVLECNPRFWASTSASVYYGVDFIQAGILLAQGKTLPDTFKTGVGYTQEIPYPSPRRFLQGLISGKYPFQGIKKDLAWQSLLDPLPTLQEIIWDRLNLVNIYDSDVMEKML
jgi:predicted ATP-grasp superfamily ATP-dependent carboligase